MLVAVDRDDARALVGEPQGCGGPDTARGAGHDGDPVGEAHHVASAALPGTASRSATSAGSRAGSTLPPLITHTTAPSGRASGWLWSAATVMAADGSTSIRSARSNIAIARRIAGSATTRTSRTS